MRAKHHARRRAESAKYEVPPAAPAFPAVDLPGEINTLVDHVLGMFSRERLSEALAATHRAGFGPHTRVLDGGRASVVSQLQRADLTIYSGPVPAPDALVILVLAPGRVSTVASIFSSLGAQGVAFAGRQKPAAPATSHPAALLPDIRIGADEVVEQ